MRWGRSKTCGYCTCDFANIYVWVRYCTFVSVCVCLFVNCTFVSVCVSVGRVLVHVLKSWICISILLNFRFVVCHVVLCGLWFVMLWSCGLVVCYCVVVWFCVCCLCVVVVLVVWYLWFCGWRCCGVAVFALAV